MPTVFLSSWFNEFNDLNGLPNNGGSVTIYIAETTTPAAVYTDYTGDTANTNPVVLDSQGYPLNPIWLPVTDHYDAIVKDADGNTVYQLNHIGLPPDGATPAPNDLGVWIDTLSAVTVSDATTFVIAGSWDVTFTQGRRLKIVTGGEGGTHYATVATATYNGGTNETTVIVVNDGTGTLAIGSATAYYSVLDSINVAVPYISYVADNVGTGDALVVNFDPAVYAVTDKMRITVKMGVDSNTVATPTIAVNELAASNIVLQNDDPLGVGAIPQYADFVYDISSGNFVLLNPSTTSEASKWAAFPVGYCQPFIPQVMGTTLTLWLAAHTDWAKLTNSVVSGIEGRAMAVSSAAHLGNTQAGSDDLIVPLHTHTGSVANHNHAGSTTGVHTHSVSDPGHTHALTANTANPSTSFAGTAAVGTWLAAGSTAVAVTGISIDPSASDIAIAYDSPAVTVNATGSSATNANIQTTVWFDWIYKVA